MYKFLATLLISVMVLSACARVRDSAFNPGNWFGKSRSEPTVNTGATGADNPLIPKSTGIFSRKKSDSLTDIRNAQTQSGGLFSSLSRKNQPYAGTPANQVSDLRVERTASGAIIHATGISSQQGAHDVRLVSDNNGEPVDGVLTYRLMAVQPTNTPQGSQRSRTFEAAEYVSTQTLETVRSIRVVGLQNVRSTTR